MMHGVGEKPQKGRVRIGSVADVFAFLHGVCRLSQARCYRGTCARPAGLTAGGVEL